MTALARIFTRQSSVVAAAALAFGIAPVSARANGASLPDTIQVSLVPGNTTELGVEATYGYLDAADGRTFTWICHEVFVPSAAAVTPQFRRGGDGSFLVTTRAIGVASINPNRSLFRSGDGCEWTGSIGLDGIAVFDVGFDPSDPSHVLAATASSGGSPQENGIYVSQDGGRTFLPALLLANRYFWSVRFARSDPSFAYATASWFSPEQAWVYATTNGGLSWSEHPFTLTVGGVPQNTAYVVAVSSTDPRIVYLSTDGSTDYLVRSTNAGQSFSSVHAVPGDRIGGTAFDSSDALWTASPAVGTFRSDDGVNFARVEAAPHARGLDADARGVFVAASNAVDGYALGETTNGGASFFPVLRNNEIAGVRACPATSEVAAVCAPLFPALAQQLGLATPTPVPQPTTVSRSRGCSCELEETRGRGIVAPLFAALAFIAPFCARRSGSRVATPERANRRRS